MIIYFFRQRGRTIAGFDMFFLSRLPTKTDNNTVYKVLYHFYHEGCFLISKHKGLTNKKNRTASNMLAAKFKKYVVLSKKAAQGRKTGVKKDLNGHGRYSSPQVRWPQHTSACLEQKALAAIEQLKTFSVQ